MVLKRTLSIFLAILMIGMTFTAFPITVNAATVDTAATAVDKTFTIKTAEELTAAEAEINSATEPSNYVIELDADIVNGSFSSTNSNAVVTIFGNGHTIDRSENGHTAIHAKDGATIKLGSADGGEKNTLTIIGAEDDSEPGILEVWPSSTIHMYDNVTLRDHKGGNYLGGGVTVQSGDFYMHGGTIDNCGIASGSVCYGGGVAVFKGGYFEMNGGTISNCYVSSDYIDDYDPNRCFTSQGGGVFVAEGSAFTMNGGTISNCEATNFGGGVAMDITYNEMQSYGMGNPKSNVTINGGTITGNQAECGGGVFASGYFYSYASVFYGYLPSGSAPSNPGFIINGGEISANTAYDAGGSAFIAMLRPSNTCQIHNAVIKNNTADNGAGIENFGYWTQMDVDGCTITGNTAVTKGGGIMLSTNSSGGYTNLKNTTVTGNTSGEIGAGVYYDNNSRLNISGADVIQNNTYNGKLNNLNVLSLSKPVYVSGALTGSQIGLSDPKLWDDGLEDEAGEAVSEDYLTSGYKNYNTANPSAFFTSDHDTWFADFSDVNDNEVRLVRKKPDYHINNEYIDDNYNNKDIFTPYVEAATKEIKVGETIDEFYTVPEVVPTATNSCPYIFKGWYYDQNNENDTRPVDFGNDKYAKDIYAHWIKVDNVEKDADDPTMFQDGGKIYGGFDLAGVQIRKEMRDYNFDDKPKMPGGMRFVTSLNMDVVNEINKIKPNNIEYGYVAATHEGWIEYHSEGVKHGLDEKLKYVSETANGINTTKTTEKDEDYFGFAKNVNCTSKVTDSKNGVVRRDHQNFDKYLLYSLVITYEEEGSDMGKDVLARPYIRYKDANGLERVAYSEYTGTSNVLGGCYTNYNAVAAMMPSGN